MERRMTDIVSKYNINDLIEARDPASGRWREAQVIELAPYRGRPGYYIAWRNINQSRVGDAPMPSSGGWTYEACMRPLQPVDDLEIPDFLRRAK
jgi:hypothetical protein